MKLNNSLYCGENGVFVFLKKNKNHNSWILIFSDGSELSEIEDDELIYWFCQYAEYIGVISDNMWNLIK